MNTLDLTRYDDHTPGPWMHYDEGIENEYGQPVYRHTDIENGYHVGKLQDTRLIEDAPKLLAALTQAYKEIAELRTLLKAYEVQNRI